MKTIDLFKKGLMAMGLLYLIFIAAPEETYANVKDNEFWTGFEASYGLTKKLDISFEEELRLNEDFGQFDQDQLNLGMKYKINKFFKVAAFFRHKIKRYDSENSFYINLSAKKDIDVFELSYRLRYHRKYPQLDDAEDYFRQKIKIKYKYFDKFTPFAAGELFYRANYKKGDRFDKYRLFLGLGYELNKHHKFDLQYIHEQEMNVKKIDLSNIFGLYYSFEF